MKNQTINQRITDLIDSMSVEEMKNLLCTYMAADEQYATRPVALEVRQKDICDRGGRYAVLMVMDDGTEKEVKFRDRYSRLIYIYTLLHPQGYQRRTLQRRDYDELCRLFSTLYFTSADVLQNAIGNDFDHFFSQAVAQSRKAIRQTAPYSAVCEIASPMKHNGKSLIPLAQDSKNIIIDNSLI